MNPREKIGEGVRRPPRVLFVDFATHFGGAVLALADLLKGLPREPEFTPHVLAYQKRAYVDALFAGVDHATGKMWLSHVTRHRVRRWATRRLRADALVRFAMRLYTLADYVQELLVSSRIYWEIRRNRIDVLHLNNGPNRMGMRAARWAGVPVVAHLRGHGGSKEVTTPHERRMAASPTVVAAIAVSRSVAESYVGHGMPGDKIVVIHDPVDLDAFDEAASRRDSVRSRWGRAARCGCGRGFR